MSDLTIDNMNFKELKNEVQSLRDELAMMKRKYEDILFNLGDENFSGAIIKEKNDMRTQISVNASGIETKVSHDDLNGKLEKYSTIEQTADAITSVVSKKANLKDAQEVTKKDEMTDKEKIYVMRRYNSKNEIVSETYYYFNKLSKKWEILSGEDIHSVFNQTAEGFEMKGNVLIDGDTVITRNLKLSGNVTWDMENSPVKTQYSVDGLSWYDYTVDGFVYIRMSFDGGKTYSDAIKSVGTDGADGQDGQDGDSADVTPENVFNALTDNGASQGIFAAFINNNNQIYINAEYLATKIAHVADELYVGDINDDAVKSLIFSNMARITTFADSTTGTYSGLSISASEIKLGSKLNLKNCTITNWGSNKPTAVFG